ncbi:hypothetical protein [Haloarcula litorea]|uniref:hypothetical protein n=1 Tax=Haloarcula litorea TaxID=3032579 RepID=UPI0023E7B0ED|nr:hypothetical protein [Halomicroarcula sp. GDY20]
MSETLELPNGDEVTPDDVFLYNGYPYRFVPVEGDEYAFVLSPLYWGDSGMDVPFPDREALVDQWGTDSRGLLSESEWADWLDDATEDPRFDDEEVAALAAELPTTWEPEGSSDGGFLSRLGF